MPSGQVRSLLGVKGLSAKKTAQHGCASDPRKFAGNCETSNSREGSPGSSCRNRVRRHRSTVSTEIVMAQSVTRALQAIKRYNARPEQIDQAILAAINVTLCLLSGGDDRVAEGFNRDIATSGR